MRATVKHVIGGLFGCVLGFGASATLHSTFTPTIASAPPAAGMVLGLTFSKAHAQGTKKTRRRNRRQAAERKAEEKRREEAEKQRLRAIRRDILSGDDDTRNCVYDSYASESSPSDIYNCDGNYYQRYEENGVTTYKGYAVGIDRGEIKKAKARRAEAKKKPQATRRATLPADCAYDSFASAASATDVYACGGVRYRQYLNKGVTGYEVVKP